MPKFSAASRYAAALMALLFAACVAGFALAQPSVKDIRAQLETTRLDLSQIEAAFQRDNLDEKRLNDLRTRLEPLSQAINDMIGRELPRADEIKARIEQLGPAPDASKGQSESPEVAKDRAEQQRLWKEADDTVRLARALALRIEQIGQAIAERRRQNFTKQILEQHASIASPWLWRDVAISLPADMRALQFLSAQWGETILKNLDWYEAVILVLLALAVVLGVPRARQWVTSGRLFGAIAPQVNGTPTNMQKAMVSLRMFALNTIVPTVLLMLVYVLIDQFDLLPGRADPVMEAFLKGLALFFFMSGLSGAVIAPGRPDWRISTLDDHQALELWRMIRLISMVIAGFWLIESIQGAIVATLPLSIATKGCFAVSVAVLMARGLRRTFGQRNEASLVDAAEAADHPAPAVMPSSALLPLRVFAWSAVIAIFGAALLGFIPLAGFLVSQTLWLVILGMMALLVLELIEEVIGSGLSAQGALGRRVREATGLNASSLDQVSVLGSGLARLLLFVAMAMVALAPWGIDSSSFAGNLKAAFFGFQVGGVTISLSTIAIALALFLIGFFITRAIQNWLDTRYLPHTGLDLGLRNSIRTILGYVGIVVAAMVSLSHLGLSLDKLTIVAGALSVGIGFGLKSIVENFISGLILLWERPIRVGDWIVVGDEQGIVKRINVRATEIDTFDRASLIIPNSEFISGRVKNWVHADRTARIIIPVNIDYTADPEKVQEVLRAAALAHRDVMSEPKPMVIFKNLGESGLDFELRCFCDVDHMSVTRSDLLYDIFRRLREEKIDIPYPTRRLEITNFPPMVDPRTFNPDEPEPKKV